MTKKQGLNVAGGFSLPLTVAADSLAIFARKGRGKTYAASVMAEEMLDRGIPIAVLDPNGDWWGLRSSASGKRDGYPVVIMGGEHADIALEPTAGRVVADFVLNERVPTILDMSEFETRADEIRFGAAFMDRLFRGKKKATGVMHLFVDEASTFAPQDVRGDLAKLEGTARNIARRGRTRGLGSSWIDQRPASVNKNVLSQMSGLLVFGITGTHDRRAIADWVTNKDTEDGLLDEMLAALSGLPRGGGYAWVPDLHVFEKITIRKRRTFDSSATPEPGETVEVPTNWTQVNLDVVSSAMAETVERLKAEDPEELKRAVRERDLRIADLERRPAEVAPAEVVHLTVPVLREGVDEKLEALLHDLARAIAGLQEVGIDIREGTEDARRLINEKRPQPPRSVPTAPVRTARSPAPVVRSEPKGGAESADQPHLKAGARRMVKVLDDFTGTPLTRTQLSTLAQVTKGGTFSTYLRAIVDAGLALVFDDDTIVGTAPGGRNYPPTGEQILAMYRPKLKAGARRMLDRLDEMRPHGLSRDDLSEQTSVTKGGTFSTYLRALVTNGLAEERAGLIYLSETVYMGERLSA